MAYGRWGMGWDKRARPNGSPTRYPPVMAYSAHSAQSYNSRVSHRPSVRKCAVVRCALLRELPLPPTLAFGINTLARPA
jgi:hypothetical protein